MRNNDIKCITEVYFECDTCTGEEHYNNCSACSREAIMWAAYELASGQNDIVSMSTQQQVDFIEGYGDIEQVLYKVKSGGVV